MTQRDDVGPVKEGDAPDELEARFRAMQVMSHSDES